MAITVHKILSVSSKNKDPNLKHVVLVLDNGVEKRRCEIGNVPDDASETLSTLHIAGVSEDAFWFGRLWSDLAPTNISSPDKTFLSKHPNKASLNGSIKSANSVPALRELVSDLSDMVFSMLEDRA